MTIKDTDELPPVCYLIMEVLAARYRTGEHTWTFPSKLRWHLLVLADAGLIGYKSGVAPRTYLAWLTDKGRQAALSPTYTVPYNGQPGPCPVCQRPGGFHDELRHEIVRNHIPRELIKPKGWHQTPDKIANAEAPATL